MPLWQGNTERSPPQSSHPVEYISAIRQCTATYSGWRQECSARECFSNNSTRTLIWKTHTTNTSLLVNIDKFSCPNCMSLPGNINYTCTSMSCVYIYIYLPTHPLACQHTCWVLTWFTYVLSLQLKCQTHFYKIFKNCRNRSWWWPKSSKIHKVYGLCYTCIAWHCFSSSVVSVAWNWADF